MKHLRIPIMAFLLVAGAVFCFSSGPVARSQTKDAYGLYDAAKTAQLVDKKVAGYNTTSGIIGGLIKIGLGALGIIFFLLVLYAGFMWMTSMGNPEKVESAKGIIEGAAIGLIIVMGSYAIATFVFTALENGPDDVTSSAQPSSSCVKNSKQDNDETDLDCGGASCIFTCVQGQKCLSTKDCIDSLRCDVGTKTCVP